MIDDVEHERLDSLLGGMQQQDEAQQRMESITHLPVTAWRCTTCDSTTDKRRPTCQVRQHTQGGHDECCHYRFICCLLPTHRSREASLKC